METTLPHGNSKAQAMYPSYYVDAELQELCVVDVSAVDHSRALQFPTGYDLNASRLARARRKSWLKVTCRLPEKSRRVPHERFNISSFCRTVHQICCIRMTSVHDRLSMGGFKQRARFFLLSASALSFSSVHAQSPQQVIQQVVDAELTSGQNDHSKWVYFQETQKPSVQIKQWVATTQQGNIERILEKDGQRLSEPEQRHRIQNFLHDTKAQNKQISANSHDDREIYDLLKLLPVAFVWTQTDATANTTSLHFDPAPKFQPPTQVARVFSSMTGELVVDNQQHRVCSIRGHLLRDVKFGGGFLGRLKQGSSFFLKQEQVGPSLWQLTSIQVQLQGNALLFKSVSLQEDDKLSKFHLESSGITLEQAAVAVMKQPDLGPEHASR